MALTLFPLEIWEAILDKLENADDIHNLMITYPDLFNEPTLRSKFSYWFFEKAIQGICEQIFDQIVNRSLRLVCRRWRKAIDNFIQNHPEAARRTGQVLDPRVAHIPIISYSAQQLFGNIRDLTLEEDLRQFTSQWSELSGATGRDTFFTRLLMLLPDAVELEGEHGGDATTYCDLSNLLIENFGNQLHFLDLNGEYGNVVAMSRYVTGILHQTPNLKYIRIGTIGIGTIGYRNRITPPGFVAGLIRGLPVLPHLLAIEVWGTNVPSELTRQLVSHFSSQLKHLVIHIDFWLEEWGSSLPSLTSFSLIEGNEEAVRAVFDSLRSAHINLISLDVRNFKNTAQIHSSLLFKTLTKFVLLEELFIYDSYACFLRKGTCIPLTDNQLPNVQLPSVKRIDMCDSSLALYPGLLAALPALEYIKVCFPHSKSFGLFSSGCGLLWDVLLPNLKAINVYSWIKKTGHRAHFVITREDYEKKLKLKMIKSKCSIMEIDDLVQCFDILWT